MTGVNNTATTGSGPTQNTGNNYLNSFTSKGTGNFSSNPVPASFNPAPATPAETSVMIGFLVSGMHFGGARIRRYRKQRNQAAA